MSGRLWACECGRLDFDTQAKALAGAVLPRGDAMPLPPAEIPPPPNSWPNFDGGPLRWRLRARQAWPRVRDALQVTGWPCRSRAPRRRRSRCGSSGAKVGARPAGEFSTRGGEALVTPATWSGTRRGRTARAQYGPPEDGGVHAVRRADGAQAEPAVDVEARAGELEAALVAVFGGQGLEVLERARPALVGALLARGEGGLHGAGAVWAQSSGTERLAAVCRAVRAMVRAGPCSRGGPVRRSARPSWWTAWFAVGTRRNTGVRAGAAPPRPREGTRR